MALVKCRYCINAYVNWNTNEGKCIIRNKQLEGSKGECKYFKNDRKGEETKK